MVGGYQGSGGGLVWQIQVGVGVRIRFIPMYG